MTIALRAAGTATGATALVTAVNPAVPTGAAATDVSILTVSVKPYSATIQCPTGWTELTEATNGTVANGVDTGSTRVALYYHIGAVAGAIGNIKQATANSMSAVIHTYSTTLGWWNMTAFTSGGDTTNGANYSATGAAGIAVASGDWVFAGTAVNADIGTVSATAIAGMSGATLGTFTQRTNAAITTGNDTRLLAGDIPVSAGSSSAAPTFTFTNASSSSGTTAWVRLREVATPTAKTPPTHVSGQFLAGTTTTTPKTTAAFDVVAGDILVVAAGASGPAVGFPATPSSTATVTWTLRQDYTNVAGLGDIRIWTGAVTATATGRTVSVSTSGTAYFGVQMEQYRGSGGVGASAKESNTTANAARAADVTLTCTDQNSSIVFAATDGNAQSGTITWRIVDDTIMTQRGADQVNAQYGGYYGYRDDVGAASGHTAGLVVPISMIPAGVAVEILGASAGSPVTVSPGGIASAEAFGTPVETGALTVSPTGIASTEAFGTPTATVPRLVSPTGISTAGVFGAVVATLVLIASPAGIGSAEAFGTATETGSLTSSAVGIGSAEAFGTTEARVPRTVSPGGIASAEIFGTLAISYMYSASPTGIASAETFGNPANLGSLTASPTGIVSVEVFGTSVATKTLTASATGIASAETFGAPVVTVGGVYVSPTGIASAETFGTTAVTLGPITCTPTGIASVGAFGTPSVNVARTVTIVAVGSAETFGAVTATLGPITASPGGVASAGALGTPSATVGSSIVPTGIASAEAFGSPAAIMPVIVTPTGIASAETFGAVAVAGSSTFIPTGITTAETFGTTVALAPITARPTGITTAEYWGVTTIQFGVLTVTPSGIVTGETFGTVLVRAFPLSSPTGIASAETFGNPTVTGALSASPTGIPTGEWVSNINVVLGMRTLSPTGISTAEAFGTPSTSNVLRVVPDSLLSVETFGVTVHRGSLTATPTGIPSQTQPGFPVVTYQTVMLPTGIASTLAFGTTTVTIGTDFSRNLSLTFTMTDERFALSVPLSRFTITDALERFTTGAPLWWTAADTLKRFTMAVEEGEEMTREVLKSAGANEYVGGTVTENTGKDLTATTIKVSLGSETQPGTWIDPATNVLGPNNVRKVTMLVGLSPNTPKGSYWLWVKVTDTPEILTMRFPQKIVVR